MFYNHEVLQYLGSTATRSYCIYALQALCPSLLGPTIYMFYKSLCLVGVGYGIYSTKQDFTKSYGKVLLYNTTLRFIKNDTVLLTVQHLIYDTRI